MSSGYTKGTPASSQIIWLEEKVKEQEQNIDAIAQINARLRDEKREANAEIERLREALRYYEMERNTGSVTATAYHDGELARSALQQKDSE